MSVCPRCGIEQKFKVNKYRQVVCDNQKCSYVEDVSTIFERYFGMDRTPMVLFRDGDKWCVLSGENLQDGMAGFGKTRLEAFLNFMQNMNMFIDLPYDEYFPHCDIPNSGCAGIFMIPRHNDFECNDCGKLLLEELIKFVCTCGGQKKYQWTDDGSEAIHEWFECEKCHKTYSIEIISDNTKKGGE